MAWLPVLLVLMFAMWFYHTRCSSKWLSSPHNYRICLFMIKWQITNWKHLFSNFLWIHIYVLSVWPRHMKHIALHLALTFMKISLFVYRKKCSGHIHSLFVKVYSSASLCEKRLCLLLSQNGFSLSIGTLKELINLI